MKLSDAKKTDDVVGQLTSQLSSSLYDIGFFEGTVDNPNVSQKISGSFAGHAADIGIRAVAMKLVLFITRSWEANGNSISTFIRFAGRSGQHIESKRKLKHPDWPEEFLQIGKVQRRLDAIQRYEQCFRRHPAYLAAVRYRNEHLAHLLDGKSDISKKLKKENFAIEELTYSQLLDLARRTSNMICAVQQAWEFSVRSPEDTISISRRYTEDFWKLLPVLAEAEKNDR